MSTGRYRHLPLNTVTNVSSLDLRAELKALTPLLGVPIPKPRTSLANARITGVVGGHGARPPHRDPPCVRPGSEMPSPSRATSGHAVMFLGLALVDGVSRMLLGQSCLISAPLVSESGINLTVNFLCVPSVLSYHK